MKIDVYQSISNPELGFSIYENYDVKYKRDGTKVVLKNKIYSVWIDNYEGGEAYVTDWDFVEEFKSHKEAKDFIINKYGKIKKLKI